LASVSIRLNNHPGRDRTVLSSPGGLRRASTNASYRRRVGAAPGCLKSSADKAEREGTVLPRLVRRGRGDGGDGGLKRYEKIEALDGVQRSLDGMGRLRSGSRRARGLFGVEKGSGRAAVRYSTVLGPGREFMGGSEREIGPGARAGNNRTVFSSGDFAARGADRPGGRRKG